MKWDETLTDGEVKALCGPMAGLDVAADDFDVTVIIRCGGKLAAYSTTDDFALIEEAMPS